MHLYILTRGIKNWEQQFITELQGKYLPFKFPNKEGKMEDVVVQLAVRPIQLYELVFPEESKDIVLNSVLGDNFQGKGTQHKKHQKFLYAIRKILGAEKIPKYKTDQIFPVTKQNVEVAAIGIKKDYWQDSKSEKRSNKKENEFYFEGL